MAAGVKRSIPNDEARTVEASSMCLSWRGGSHKNVRIVAQSCRQQERRGEMTRTRICSIMEASGSGCSELGSEFGTDAERVLTANVEDRQAREGAILVPSQHEEQQPVAGIGIGWCGDTRG